MQPDELDGLLGFTAKVVDRAEVPDDPAEAERLLRSAERAGSSLLGLAARIRAAANTECGTPPDLDGLCMACGRKTAEPIQSHKPGCSIFDVVAWPVFRARRIATRTSRLGRLMWGAARQKGSV